MYNGTLLQHITSTAYKLTIRGMSTALKHPCKYFIYFTTTGLSSRRVRSCKMFCYKCSQHFYGETFRRGCMWNVSCVERNRRLRAANSEKLSSCPGKVWHKSWCCMACWTLTCEGKQTSACSWNITLSVVCTTCVHNRPSLCFRSTYDRRSCEEVSVLWQVKCRR